MNERAALTGDEVTCEPIVTLPLRVIGGVTVVAEDDEGAGPFDEPMDDAGNQPAVQPVLEDAALEGPIGDAVQFIAPYTEAHPAGILISALVMLGAIMGRGPHLMLDGARHGTNLSALLIGITGHSKKGTAVARARRIAEAVEPTFWQQHRVSGLSSGEGLISRVRDASRPNHHGDIEHPGVPDKRLLVIESEFGAQLKRMKGQSNSLSHVLRDAWDGETLQTQTKFTPMCATDPHIALIGQITPDELRSLASQTDFVGGTFNRFLFCHVERARELPDADSGDPSGLASKLAHVAECMCDARLDLEMRLDIRAQQLYRDCYSDLTQARGGRIGDATARGAALVMRVAMIYAITRGSKTICEIDLRAALAVWNYSVESARFLIGGDGLSPLAFRLMTALEAAGLIGLTRSALRDVAGSNAMPAKRISEALHALSRQGIARCGLPQRQGGGRPPETWFSNRAVLASASTAVTPAYIITADDRNDGNNRSNVDLAPGLSSLSSLPSHSSDIEKDAVEDLASENARVVTKSPEDHGTPIDHIGIRRRTPRRDSRVRKSSA